MNATGVHTHTLMLRRVGGGAEDENRPTMAKASLMNINDATRCSPSKVNCIFNIHNIRLSSSSIRNFSPCLHTSIGNVNVCVFSNLMYIIKYSNYLLYESVQSKHFKIV